MAITVDIEKKLGNFHLKVNFSGENEVIALLGASGSGKTMTLKCIAGIEKPDKGRIIVDGVTLFDSEKGINLTPQQRRTGLLFQSYALFPNMTVEQNILAGTHREKDASHRRAMAKQIMARFHLEEQASLYPRQLSGGQQQRTALARLLVSGPDILLLDEPFSALDSHLRFRMEQEVRQIIRDFGKTVVLVSHDRDEVYRLADRIAVLDAGAVSVCGETQAVFRNPRTRAAAVLTGCKNISRAIPIDETHVFAADWGMMLEVLPGGQDCEYVGIRMHDLRPGAGINPFSCRVVSRIENPFSVTLLLQPDSAESQILWEFPKTEKAACLGQNVTVCLPPEKILLLKGERYEKN